jgi:prepilin-type processing-associated H-X9-DG protein
VTDRHPITNGRLLARAGVDDAVIFYAGIAADDNGAIITPNASARSNPAAFADGHVAEHIG